MDANKKQQVKINVTPEDALETIREWQKRIEQVHTDAAADTAAGHIAEISASVPACLIDYLDKYGIAAGKEQRELVEEALCLFCVIRAIEDAPALHSPNLPRRPVRRYRSRRPRRA